MSEINEYLSNSTESRGEKHVINYPNVSESVRLEGKRKMETETTSPKEKKRTENEVRKKFIWLKSCKDLSKYCGDIHPKI